MRNDSKIQQAIVLLKPIWILIIAVFIIFLAGLLCIKEEISSGIIISLKPINIVSSVDVAPVSYNGFAVTIHLFEKNINIETIVGDSLNLKIGQIVNVKIVTKWFALKKDYNIVR